MPTKSQKALQSRMDVQYDDLIARKRRGMRIWRNWWKIAITIIGIYVALPISAPILMKAGATGPASALYTIYGPMCHQFAFRSVFLFGEEPYYPRSVAQAGGATFEEAATESKAFQAIYTRQKQEDLREIGARTAADAYTFNPSDLLVWDQTLQFSAREFRGDEKLGYKIALCERDIMIYAVMFFAAIGWAIFRDRIRPAPLVLYVLLGLMPIALDGFSQLFGYPPFDSIAIFESWQVRETTPFFRFLTGGLFGLMNVWLAFPYIHRSAVENVRRLEESVQEIDRQRKKLAKNLKS